MDDAAIAQALMRDLSVGAEEFREELLSRCLSLLSDDDEAGVLDDELLTRLAAAGGPLPRGLDDAVS